MNRAWLIITTYKRSLSFPHSDYTSFEYLVGGTSGWGTGGDKEWRERWINFQWSRHFGRATIFILFANPLPQWTLQKWHFSFQFIYLPPLYIDRQIKMNLSKGSMHATSIYSPDSLFLFSLKHNLSFVFKIPSSLSLSLQASLQEALLPCFVPETLLKAKRWR